MAILRVDIERALNELVSQENGMRFQGLAVALGKKRWPELIARQRKKDFGLDAYAPASLTPEKIGKGLAASVTPTLKKVSDDAKEAKDEYLAVPDANRADRPQSIASRASAARAPANAQFRRASV
jgi:hypothetical protein